MDSQLNSDVNPLESDPERKERAVTDLKCRLENDTKGQGQIARLVWLMSHLEDYLDRWTSCMTFFPISAFLHNDLHVVLTIAVDLIEEEVRLLPNYDTFKLKWKEFSSAVRKIDNQTSVRIAGDLEKKFECARKELCGGTEDRKAEVGSE
jgi:hypothetical protein